MNKSNEKMQDQVLELHKMNEGVTNQVDELKKDMNNILALLE